MGKLMKYDLRAAMKLFVPLWLGVLVLALVNSLSLRNVLRNLGERISNTVQNLFTVAYILALLAVVVLTVVFIVLRFYQSTVKEEAYLTFTLPVGMDAIVLGKALSGLVIFVGSVIVCMLSLLILAGQQDLLRYLWESLDDLCSYCSAGDVTLCAIFSVLLLLTAGMSQILRIYLSIALGQLAQKHRVGMAVLAYVGIGLTLTVLISWCAVPLLAQIFVWFSEIQTFQDTVRSIWLSLGGMCLYNIVFGIIYYIPTRCLLKYQLNLE